MQPAISINQEASKEDLIDISEVRVWFPVRTGFFSSIFGGESKYVKAVDNVSFNIKKGEIFCLAGESGSGKTTLGKAIIGLIKPTSGVIQLNGEDITSQIRPYEMNMIFQDPYESLPPHMTAYDIVAEPLEINKLVLNYEEKIARVTEAMEVVGLTPFEKFRDLYPHQLSGGQRQRIAIASALAVKPKFVVADEPVSMLDASIRATIIQLILELRRKFDISYLFITHDLALASIIAERIAIMYLGQIVELSDARELVKNPLHPYTQALLSVIPLPDPELKRNKIILKGEIPSPIDIPQGCRFYKRCTRSEKECEIKAPKLVEIRKGHYVACHSAA